MRKREEPGLHMSQVLLCFDVRVFHVFRCLAVLLSFVLSCLHLMSRFRFIAIGVSSSNFKSCCPRVTWHFLAVFGDFPRPNLVMQKLGVESIDFSSVGLMRLL